jgi:hypothetical protein
METLLSRFDWNRTFGVLGGSNGPVTPWRFGPPKDWATIILMSMTHEAGRWAYEWRTQDSRVPVYFCLGLLVHRAMLNAFEEEGTRRSATRPTRYRAT